MSKKLGYNVIPQNYAISIDTDLKRFIFKGNETIRAVAGKKTRTIILNARDLKIKKATVYAGNKIVQQATFSIKDELLTLRFAKPMSGELEIDIQFEGKNNDQLLGFYRGTYMDKGKKEYLLTTQFEPADARAAFPCFDQPDMKATFDLCLMVDKELEAVSNMPIKRVETNGGKKRIFFKRTPIMSTYLLYMGVGKFKFRSDKYRNVTIRGVAVGDKVQYLQMSINFAKNFLKYYEDYFGILYPLPKLDLIAIPDFAAGAMENWGAITFREIALLGDEKTTGVARKQQIAETISHELAHQWFGDLCTMRWWDDLWLNESFATFMACKAMEAVYPEWQMMLQYYLDTINTALVADSVKTSHPIVVQIRSPAEISSLFDRISYDKGGSVLKMVEDYVGAEVFRKGLHHYLDAHQHGNGTKEDLWNAIQKYCKPGEASIARFISQWLNTAGYPVIKTEKNDPYILLEQKRFLISGKAEQTIWPIPLHYLSDSENKSKFMLFNKQKTRIKSDGDWTKLNYGQNGFYRVEYDQNLLHGLGKAIKEGKLNGLDAWGIETDLFSFARSGFIKMEEYLAFVEDYCFDAEFPATSSILGHLSWFNFMLYGTALENKIRGAFGKYCRIQLKRLGWERKENESNIDIMDRVSALSGLGLLGDAEVLSKFSILFNEYCDKGVKIDANLKGAVFSTLAWNLNEEVSEKLFDLYEKETMPDDKIKLLASLGRFKDEKLLKRSLDYSMSDKVRYQDGYLPSTVISMNPSGKALIPEWSAKNWKELMKRYPPGPFMLSTYVGNFETITDEVTAEKVRLFFSQKANRRVDIERDIGEAFERIKANINFMKKNEIA